MAISYIGGTTQAFAGTTSTVSVSLTGLTGGFDTAPSAGDFVVMFYGTGSNVTTGRTLSVSSPSGWTPLTQLLGSDTYDTHFRGFYKVMGSTPDTSVTVSGTGSTSDAGAVVVHVFRGVDETTPLDVAVVTANGFSTSLANPGAITPTTSGAVILAAAATAHVRGVHSFSSPELFNFLSIGSDDTYDVSVGVGWTDWTSGAFDPAAFSWSGSNSITNSWAAYTLALRPATGSGVSVDADDITTGSPALGSPALSQRHVLTADGIAIGAPVLGAAGLAQGHVLAADGIATGQPILGNLTVTQTHILSATTVTTGTVVLGQPVLSQTHILSLQAVTTGQPSLDQAVFSQIHSFTLDEVITGSPLLGNPIVVVTPQGTFLGYWDGTSWVFAPLKKWDGSSWANAKLKRWDGSSWV